MQLSFLKSSMHTMLHVLKSVNKCKSKTIKALSKFDLIKQLVIKYLAGLETDNIYHELSTKLRRNHGAIDAQEVSYELHSFSFLFIWCYPALSVVQSICKSFPPSFSHIKFSHFAFFNHKIIWWKPLPKPACLCQIEKREFLPSFHSFQQPTPCLIAVIVHCLIEHFNTTFLHIP